MNAQSEPRVFRDAVQAGIWGVRAAYGVSFAIPVLNPAYQGTALYFYIWLPLLDVAFLRSIGEWRVDTRQLISVAAAALLLLGALHNPEATLRFALLAMQTAYLTFLLRHGALQWLRWALCAHVAVAMAQLLFFFTPGGVPELLTPTGLSRAVWGAEFAPATFTNFGFETFLPRVSGLHRESGFFSTFVISLYLVFSEAGEFRRRRWLIVPIALGLLASFSKITFAVLIIVVLRKLAILLNRFPVWLALLGFTTASVVAADVVFGTFGQEALSLGEGTAVSFVHRFHGYYVFSHLAPTQMLLGTSWPGLELLPAEVARFGEYLTANIQGLREYNFYPGLGAFLVRTGILGMACLAVLLTALGVRSATLLVAAVTTFAVAPDTLQNFVVLTWLYIVLCGRPRAIAVSGKGSGEVPQPMK